MTRKRHKRRLAGAIPAATHVPARLTAFAERFGERLDLGTRDGIARLRELLLGHAADVRRSIDEAQAMAVEFARNRIDASDARQRAWQAWLEEHARTPSVPGLMAKGPGTEEYDDEQAIAELTAGLDDQLAEAQAAAEDLDGLDADLAGDDADGEADGESGDASDGGDSEGSGGEGE